jgi:uncharacterized C2H2 Zn-finger protein
VSAPQRGFRCPRCGEELADRDAFACHVSAEHTQTRKAGAIRLAYLKRRWQRAQQRAADAVGVRR